MYNVLIKDFASITFNKQKSILTIKFLTKKNNNKKLSKLFTIAEQLVQDKSIILILDLNNSMVLFPEIQKIINSKNDTLDINKLIVISRNKVQNTFYSVFNSLKLKNTNTTVQFVHTFDEAIRYT